jgi:LPS export ABC transporter protein LptC
MLNRGSFLVVVVLTFLLVLSSWYVATLTRVTPFQGGGSFSMGQLSHAHLIQATSAGLVQYEGDIESSTQFKDGNVNFQGLNLTFFGQPGSTPWTLAADGGSVVDANNEITLQGNVSLSRPKTVKNAPVLIQTQAAMIYPNQNKVTGTDLITFTQPGTINKTTAVGFVANTQAQWIKLLSQVKSTYAGKASP